MEYDYLIVGVQNQSPVKMKITTEDKFLQVYVKFEEMIGELDRCSYWFALFIGNRMDENNQIELTALFKNRFIERTSHKYTLNTVNSAVKKLKDIHFLAPLAPRQSYIVNPVYMFKSSINNRFEVAKQFRTNIMAYYKDRKIDWDVLNEFTEVTVK